MRGAACHFLHTWTLPQTCTFARSQHQGLSFEPAPAGIDSLNAGLQPCKPKPALFPGPHLWPFSQVFGTHLHVTLETATSHPNPLPVPVTAPCWLALSSQSRQSNRFMWCLTPRSHQVPNFQALLPHFMLIPATRQTPTPTGIAWVANASA